MRKPKTDLKRGLSKIGTGFLWLLRLSPVFVAAFVFVRYPSKVLESLKLKIVWFFPSLLIFALIVVALVLVLVALVALLLGWIWLSDWCRAKLRGYSVHRSGNGESGGIYYQEGQKRLMMGFNGYPFVIHLPSDEAWNRQAPAWAKDCKAEIIGRIKKQYQHAEFREDGSVSDFSLDKSEAGGFDGLLESQK